jgi:hypothetical protein
MCWELSMTISLLKIRDNLDLDTPAGRMLSK